MSVVIIIVAITIIVLWVAIKYLIVSIGERGGEKKERRGREKCVMIIAYNSGLYQTSRSINAVLFDLARVCRVENKDKSILAMFKALKI